MKPEAQRIAIAEACGIKVEKPDGQGYWRGSRTLPCDINGKTLPDYLNDLNAIQSGVKLQASQFRAKFDECMATLAITRKCLYCELTAQDWADCFIQILTSKRD